MLSIRVYLTLLEDTITVVVLGVDVDAVVFIVVVVQLGLNHHPPTHHAQTDTPLRLLFVNVQSSLY